MNSKLLKLWRARRDSNPRPPGSKPACQEAERPGSARRRRSIVDVQTSIVGLPADVQLEFSNPSGIGDTLFLEL